MAGQSYTKSAPSKPSYQPDPNELIKLFRDKIKSRGARGIIGLQKLFAIMDDDGSKSISLYEFTKACKDFRVGINEENVPLIFDLFDTNRDGTLNVDEFLMAIRGELSEYRRSIIEQAFRKIDRDSNGALEVDDIRELYNAKSHPDVMQGKKSEEQILMDFIETFETHHNIRNGTNKDSRVTLEEFIEYYSNISVSIDNDDYFMLMMNNSWNIKGDSSTYKKYGKAWADDDVSSHSSKQAEVRGQASPPVTRSGVASRDNPLVTTQDYYRPVASASRGYAGSKMHSNPPIPKEVEVQQTKTLYKQVKQEIPPRNPYQGGYNPNPPQ